MFGFLLALFSLLLGSEEYMVSLLLRFDENVLGGEGGEVPIVEPGISGHDEGLLGIERPRWLWVDVLRDESGVAALERLPTSEAARLHLPVSGASRCCAVRGASTSCAVVLLVVDGLIGGGPVSVKSGCAPGCLKPCRSGSRGATRVTMRGDVRVGGVGIGRDLAASEICQDCCQSIENGAHGVKGGGLKCVR